MQQEKVKYYARFTSSRDDAHSLTPIETDVHCLKNNVSSSFANSTDKSPVIYNNIWYAIVSLVRFN